MHGLCAKRPMSLVSMTRTIGVRRHSRHLPLSRRPPRLVVQSSSPSQHHQQRTRRSIVTQISPTTSLLRSEGHDNEVYLLGTAHISEASANEAIQLISVVQPQKVFIELDPPRAARLRASEGDTNMEHDQLEKVIHEAANQFAKSGLPMPMPNTGGDGKNPFADAIKSFYEMLRGYGYIPGIEMLAAMKEADKLGAELVYGDRDITLTMNEMKAAFGPKLLMGMMSAPPPPAALQSIMMDMYTGGVENLGTNVEVMKTRENARMISTYMNSAAPEISDVLIHRRDRAMAENLKKHCGEGKVVAVVGLAHVDGIEKEWQKLDGGTPKLGA